MGIVGGHPETGVRVEAERPEGGPPWLYRGEAVTPSERLALQASVADDGTVIVELQGDTPAPLRDRVRLILPRPGSTPETMASRPLAHRALARRSVTH